MALGTFTLAGTFYAYDDTPASGTVRIDGYPSQVIRDTAGDKVFVGPKMVTLDTDGHFSITLPTDSTSGLSETIGYRVSARLKHQIVEARTLVARADGATVNFADITPDESVVPLEPTGVSTAELDALVAAEVEQSGSATNAALTAAISSSIASNVDPMDNVMTALDMRQVDGPVIAAAGDSTMSPYTTGAFVRAWKELAASLWPDRPFQAYLWGKDANAYPGSPTIWQDAAIISDPGGTETGVVVVADSFSETNAEAVGRTPEVGGGAWAGTSGAYLANAGELVANPAYAGGGIPAIEAPTIARSDKDITYTGQWRISTAEASSKQRRIVANATSVSATTAVRIAVTGSTTATCVLQKIIGNTATTLATFPAGTIPSSTAAAWYNFSLSVTGTAVSATLNGNTVSGTLDSADVTALGSYVGIQDQSTSAGLRNIDIRGTVTTPPVVGGPSPLGYATVYNAAVAGAAADYQQARIAAMFPVQPDVLFLHFGHNYADEAMTPTQVLAGIQSFVDALFATWDACPVVVSSQNPEFPPADTTRIGQHLANQAAIRAYAKTKGWGYIPVFEAFAAEPDGGQALVQTDGIHPVIGAGTDLQTDVYKAWLTARSKRPVA